MGKAIVLQARDWELLRGLLESRVMQTTHVAEIYFGGKREMAKKRLQKLKGAGLVAERPRFPAEPAVLRLTAAGLRILDAEGVLAEYPPMPLAAHLWRLRVSESRLRHELAVMDAVSDVFRAAREGGGFEVRAFDAWPQRVGERWARQPDAVIYVQAVGGPLTLCVEADRSTESLSVVLSKVRDYAETPGREAVLFSFDTAARCRSVESQVRRHFPGLAVSREIPGLPLRLEFMCLGVVKWRAKPVR